MGWKTTLAFVIAYAVLFAASYRSTPSSEPQGYLPHVAVGLSLGLLIVLEVERKPRSSWLTGFWQTCAGSLGGICAVLLAGGTPSAAGVGALVGGLLGFLAPWWVRHI